MNYDSSKNQDIKRKFVEREVYSCVTSMVEYIIKQGFEDREAPFSMDDLTNYYTDNSSKIEILEEKKEQLDEEITDIENDIEELEDGEDNEKEIQVKEEEKEKLEEEIQNIENQIEELEREQDEPNEVYEWWMVSSWLCNKLKEHGEVVLEDESIWGRCCTGQAILLDGVISEICTEMGILEGQEHEWKV